MTTSLLFQTIDQLSREKGIDAQIIIAAVEDAVLVATRKYYKSSEELQSRFNKVTGRLRSTRSRRLWKSSRTLIMRSAWNRR